jgi:hypothetical protein
LELTVFSILVMQILVWNGILLYFSYTNDAEHFSYTYWPFLHLSLKSTLFKNFTHLKHKVIWVLFLVNKLCLEQIRFTEKLRGGIEFPYISHAPKHLSPYYSYLASMSYINYNYWAHTDTLLLSMEVYSLDWVSPFVLCILWVLRNMWWHAFINILL